MKLSFPTFALSLLVGASVEAKGPITESMLKAAGEKRRSEQNFWKAIHSDDRVAKAKQAQYDQAQKRKLFNKLQTASRKLTEASSRMLADQQNNGNGYVNGEYSFENYEWMNPVFQQMIEDGVFDMTARAFKYSGCAAIKSYDIDQAGQSGNPMVVDTYAVFRLCPEDSCNKYSLTGCGKNYGEYVVDLKTYLGFMLEFYEDRYGAYCDYCYPCDYDYQVMKHQTQGQCYDQLDKQEYNQQHNQKQQAWENYYEQNYGDMSDYAAQAEEAQQAQNEAAAAYTSEYGYNNAAGEYMANQYQAQNGGNQYQGGYGGNRKMQDYSYFMSSSSSSSNGDSSSSSNYNVQNSNGNSNGDSSSSSNYNGNADYSNGYNFNGYNNNGQGYANQNDQAGEYYQQWYQQQLNQEDQNNYGFYNENGQYVDICANGGSGVTDSNGVEYSVDCQGYQSKYMQCSDGALCDYCEYQVDQKYLSCDNYICKDYYTYCSDFYEDMGDDDEAFDLFEFLECTEYVNDYGQRYFIGPHCGSDHFTISLGVFEDENCLDYVGETISLSKVLGYNSHGSGPYGTDESTFFHLPHECVSCDGMEQYEQYQEEQQQDYQQNGGNGNYYANKNAQQGSGVYGDYVQAPDEQVDGVVAMCAALFERSAQCNVHMTNYDMMAKYMDDLDTEYEQLYCNFIDNIVYGSYDESGEILLKPESFDLSEWRNPEQYKKLKMPAGQAIGLALSVLLVVALSALAFFTQRSLTRQSTPWRPKRATGVNMDEEEPKRTGSGITMGRSQSGVNAAPLI